MANALGEFTDLVTPSAEDAEVAKESGRKLSRFLGGKFRSKKPMLVTFRPGGSGEGETVEIPLVAFRLLATILAQMSMGNTLTLVPIHAELTTREAADLLNVSRPFLVGQLEKGVIPFRMVGAHRRILFQDLMEYKKRSDAQRLQALQELVDLDQELGLQ